MKRKTIITYTDEELKELNTVAEELDNATTRLCKLVNRTSCEGCPFDKWCRPLEDIKVEMFRTIEEIIDNDNKQELESEEM